MKKTITLLITLFSIAAFAEDVKEEITALPGTEIVLANIIVKKGQVSITNAQNITSRTQEQVTTLSLSL